MAVVDTVEVWNANIGKLEEKIAAGEERLEHTVSVVSGLIAEDAAQKKINDAKRDAEAAEIDLKHLINALVNAREELEDARLKQIRDTLLKRADKIDRLQEQRNVLLSDAEDHFFLYIEAIEASEKLAKEIHQTGAGCRPMQEAVNQRHGGIIAWCISHLIQALPIAEVHIGQVAANHNHARQQIADKGLPDTQADFHEIFYDFEQLRNKSAA